ncbi:Histidine kinase-, DNA gyrase B-, and HSP90-like ATPase [Paenibacillus sp. UNCCL117]|uniref:cache domain-containing sensor histidine kinase n=1 Tax=unclassified Paenibacillus TaxID=185978 RepID=UPI00088A3CFA|nr:MULTISPECIES: sensor histidine kinase [unclassified Paenibacillus]SDD07633.1 Histidine kinase-, DNA gyrase B-, and HSP90-like ATPase [Paenibacillus sp. cl123]SFW31409.1 Histidine kinase-, DNA gyrase B-, and HSP90-like ATPase [Paenibacillus sp. UNCCL117]
MKFFSVKKLISPGVSIQGKIFVAFTLVTLLGIVAVTSSVYVYMRETVKKNAVTSVKESIRQADDSLNLRLEEIGQLNTVVVTNKTVLDTLLSATEEPSYEWFQEQRRIEEVLSAVIAYKPYITRAAVIGLNGKVFYVGSPWLDNSILHTPMMNDILHQGSVRAYFRQSGSGDAIVTGRQIRYNRQIIGIVMFDLNDQFIRKTYDVKPTSDSMLYVIDENEEFIYEPGTGGLEKETVIKLNRELAGSNASVEKTIDQKSYLVISRQSEYTGWSTLALVPMPSLLTETVRIRNMIAQVAIVVFILIVIGTSQVSSRITRNIRRLRAMMMHVMEGNMSLPTVEIRSRDEIGQLYQAFKRMVEELKRLMEGIRTTEREKREAELAVLQAQIRPHFLYNTLNTVKYLAKLNGVPNIVEVSESLIELMRGVLGNSNEFLSLQEELQYVRSYVNIEKYKYVEPIHVDIQIEDEALLRCRVLKLMLQPIVENAIIHGVASSEHGGFVVIRIYGERKELRIEVRDNGQGMSAEQIEALFDAGRNGSGTRFSGMGIRNVHERIVRLYGDPYGVFVHSEPGAYTSVLIKFPWLAGEGEDATT